MPYADPEIRKLKSKDYCKRYRERHSNDLAVKIRRRKRENEARKTWSPEEREKHRLYMAEYRNSRKEKFRAHNRLRYTGWTAAEFREALYAQQGCCKICGQLLELGRGATGMHADHDHATGLRRGILCRGCNLSLGYLRDDTWRVQNALNYLTEYHQEKQSCLED